MTPTPTRILALLAVATLPLAAASAQPKGAKVAAAAAPVPAPDDLTPQEREMLALGNEFSRRCSEAIDAWLQKKEVTPERLFGFLYYPMPDTDPPKFTTDYDKLSDRAILGIEEEILAR